MSEDTASEDTGETTGKGDPAKHALSAQLGRMVWSRDFTAKNPDATPEQKREAWKSARPEYVKLGRQMQRTLVNHGFSFTAPDKEAVKAKKQAKGKKAAAADGAEAAA